MVNLSPAPGRDYTARLADLNHAARATPELAQPARLPAPAIQGTDDSFASIVSETYRGWRHEGGKVGKLAGASALGLILPSMLATHLPAVAGLATHPVGLMVAITLSCLEEETLGLGRRLGEGVGAGIGAGVGVLHAMRHKSHAEKPAMKPRVALPVRRPTGAAPRERLLPAGLHKLQRKLLGRLPERSRSTEMGEVLGMNMAIQAGSILLPMAVASLVGGPVALVMKSLVGTIVGMVATGIVENKIGLGRALGELGGQAISLGTGGRHARRRKMWPRLSSRKAPAWWMA